MLYDVMLSIKGAHAVKFQWGSVEVIWAIFKINRNAKKLLYQHFSKKCVCTDSVQFIRVKFDWWNQWDSAQVMTKKNLK